MKDTVRIAVFNTKGWIKDIMTRAKLKSINVNQSFELAIDPDLPTGKYQLLFAVNCGIYPPTANSKRIPLIVE
jgi:hypothetical protein